MSFPVNPNIGDRYTLGNTQYECNGVAWDVVGTVNGNAVEEIESRVSANESSIDSIDGRVTTVENNKLDTTDLLTEMKAVDGEGSGLDADLLRGLPADFTSSLAANGYQKLPSGLIIQWGWFVSPDDTVNTVTFPIAFPNYCASISRGAASQGSDIDTDSTTEENADWTPRRKTATQFDCDRDNNLANDWSFSYIAIGY